MAILLGIDTGGTYTDAVLFDEERGATGGVIAKAKALTTRHDLAIGIAEAVAGVLASSRIEPSSIALVSLSTTLATNALVEGQGGSVGLVMIGFEESALSRAGLAEALKGDPALFLAGGHDAHGNLVKALDLDRLAAEIDGLAAKVSAFAVASQFAVRNPQHEIAARDLILSRTGHPVTCSHELSAKLDGPRRAMTSVLNARLIGLIHRLIASAERSFATHGINAPLMVVRGDGALVSAAVARMKPIETILSGPAASLVGASFLTGERDAVVSDIGGTTTDVAVLQNGQPRLDPLGARVGGWQTMVEAVAMDTIGLGGDSEVRAVPDGMNLQLTLGPRRVVPLSLAASEHGEVVHDMLDRQLKQPRPEEYDGRLARALVVDTREIGNLPAKERAVFDRLQGGPVAVDKLLRTRTEAPALDRLVSLGLVQICALTPSDAAHVLGQHRAWDSQAAEKAAALFARKRDARGLSFQSSALELCQGIFDRLVRISAETLLETAFARDGFEDRGLSRHVLTRSALDGHRGVVDLQIRLSVPVIGLGASAPLYYPHVARLLGSESIVPEHAGVANAVGAVVGRVRIPVSGTVSESEPGRYRVHAIAARGDFISLEDAMRFVSDALTGEARRQAVEAGADEIEVKIERCDRTAEIEGATMLIESVVTAIASGRPRIAA